MRFTRKELIELIEKEVPDGPIELIYEERGFLCDKEVVVAEIRKSFPSKVYGTHDLSIGISWKGKGLC